MTDFRVIFFMSLNSAENGPTVLLLLSLKEKESNMIVAV